MRPYNPAGDVNRLPDYMYVGDFIILIIFLEAEMFMIRLVVNRKL